MPYKLILMGMDEEGGEIKQKRNPTHRQTNKNPHRHKTAVWWLPEGKGVGRGEGGIGGMNGGKTKKREMSIKKSSKTTLGNVNITGITLPSNMTALKI